MKLKEIIHEENHVDSFNRVYENNVVIVYLIDREEKRIGVSWVQAQDTGHGNGTKAFSEFINEFKNYTITLDSVLEAVNFYKRLGFIKDHRVSDSELVGLVWWLA